MKSILFLGETIQREQFICIYHKNKKAFSQFLCAFFKSKSNFDHFQINMTLIAYVFPKYGLRKTLLDKCLKSPV